MMYFEGEKHEREIKILIKKKLSNIPPSIACKDRHEA